MRAAATVLVATALVNFSWSNHYKPDTAELLANLGSPRRRSRPRHPDVPPAVEPGGQRARARAVGKQNPDRAGHADLRDGQAAGPADLDADAARRFVDLARAGGLGDHYRRAADLGTALAVEHGFDDAPQRVADAIAVFVDPNHR